MIIIYIKIKDPKVLNLKSNESIYFSRNVLDSRYQEYRKPLILNLNKKKTTRPSCKKGAEAPYLHFIYMGQSP
jgi:hypothetical protein